MLLYTFSLATLQILSLSMTFQTISGENSKKEN